MTEAIEDYLLCLLLERHDMQDPASEATQKDMEIINHIIHEVELEMERTGGDLQEVNAKFNSITGATL